MTKEHKKEGSKSVLFIESKNVFSQGTCKEIPIIKSEFIKASMFVASDSKCVENKALRAILIMVP